jgi:DNA-binding MarR family transcriptional regulator
MGTNRRTARRNKPSIEDRNLFCTLLTAAAKRCDSLYDAELRKLFDRAAGGGRRRNEMTSVSTTGYAILRLVRQRSENSTTVEEVAQGLGLKTSTASLALRRLQFFKLIRTRRSKTDQRSKDVWLTSQGAAKLKQGSPAVDRADAEVLRVLGRADADTLAELLVKLERGLRTSR